MSDTNHTVKTDRHKRTPKKSTTRYTAILVAGIDISPEITYIAEQHLGTSINYFTQIRGGEFTKI